MKLLVISRMVICLSIVMGAVGYSADFYIDPINGASSGDGSLQSPWRSLQEVLDNGLVRSRQWESLPPDETTVLVVKNPQAPVRGGDTIWLKTGDYGALTITGYYNEDQITVAAAPGHDARFSTLLLRGSSHWTVRGLQLSPEFADPFAQGTIVDLDSHNWQGPVHDIALTDCTIQSVADTSDWSLEDWNNLPSNGIQVDGARMTIRDNQLKNVNFGISVVATDSLIEGNVIENFAGDGLRGLGDRTVFQYNTVKNCYDVNENHDDGFQSWSVGPDGVGTGEVVGVVLRGNTIINYENPDQPFRGTLQGIGCFDGMFVDWIVENNVVTTDHWHGITLLGARNSRVINNTVIDPNDEDPGPPWIDIGDHKDGTPPTGCIVRNNLTTALNNAEEVVEDHNLIIENPAELFVDAANNDLHLNETAPAVDQGSADLAPTRDRDRIPRPQGEGVDIGAYEWHTDDVQPDGGPDADADADTDGDTDTDGDDHDGDAGGCGCRVLAERSTLSLLGQLISRSFHFEVNLFRKKNGIVNPM